MTPTRERDGGCRLTKYSSVCVEMNIDGTGAARPSALSLEPDSWGPRRVEGGTLPVRSPKSFLIWAIVIAVAAVVVHVAREPVAPPPRTGPSIAGRAKVIDGDSLEIAGERIRLFGIDAPESRQECRDAGGRPYPCGREAARALAAASTGRTVECMPVAHDRYERDVAVCTADGRDLSELMVREGHAIELPQHSRGRYTAAERQARTEKRGLWAGEFQRPAAWRQQHPR
jgi:endonuclease YncB( thermonuclease family)